MLTKRRMRMLLKRSRKNGGEYRSRTGYLVAASDALYQMS